MENGKKGLTLSDSPQPRKNWYSMQPRQDKKDSMRDRFYSEHKLVVVG